MALPTVAELKEHLRIESNVEDALIGRYLKFATAMIETFLQRPITSGRTFSNSSTISGYRVLTSMRSREVKRDITPPQPTDTSALDAEPDYADRIEPLLSMAIYDTVADWYQRRNPNAQSEASGGSISTAYASQLRLPVSVRDLLSTISL